MLSKVIQPMQPRQKASHSSQSPSHPKDSDPLAHVLHKHSQPILALAFFTGGIAASALLRWLFPSRYSRQTRSTRPSRKPIDLSPSEPPAEEPTRTPEHSGEQPPSERPILPAGPRLDYLGWEDWFMSLAALASLRSKDPRTRVGAAIVGSDGIVCGMGYNGMPRGVPDSSAPWSRRRELSPTGMSKHDFVCHAELNAILNRNSLSLSPQPAQRKSRSDSSWSPPASRIYVTLFPCCECAKLIVQTGIGEVVYEECKSPNSAAAASHIFHMAGVKIRHHSRSSHCLSLVPLNTSASLSS